MLCEYTGYKCVSDVLVNRLTRSAFVSPTSDFKSKFEDDLCLQCLSLCCWSTWFQVRAEEQRWWAHCRVSSAPPPLWWSADPPHAHAAPPGSWKHKQPRIKRKTRRGNETPKHTHTRRENGPSHKNTDIRFSPPPAHRTQECLMLWKHTTSECLLNKLSWSCLIHFATLDSDSPPIMAKRLGVPPEDRGNTVSKSNVL